MNGPGTEGWGQGRGQGKEQGREVQTNARRGRKGRDTAGAAKGGFSGRGHGRFVLL